MIKITLRLAIKSLKFRTSAVILNVISIALSVVLLLGIERVRSNIEKSFTNTISGTDLIVGAQTGNLALLLSTVFHKGNVNQNISWDAYSNVKSNTQIDWTIPISLGDSHKGFAVIGTNQDFFKHYRYGLNQSVKANAREIKISETNIVVGSKVAKDLGYKLNDQIVLTHGMGAEDFSSHKDAPFKITAILQPTGTPIDNSLLVSLNALDAIHSHFYNQNIDPFAAIEHTEQNHDHNHNHSNTKPHPEALTGFFVGVKNKSDILQLQRAINTNKSESLMAIMPAVTLLELWSIINPIEKVLKIISFIVLFISLGSILTNILVSLKQRRREMSILRSIGASPRLIFGLIILESIGIVCVGILLGICILTLILIVAQPLLSQNFGLLFEIWHINSTEVFMLLAILVSGVLIGLFPAFQSYKQTLADGLTIKY